MLLFFFQHNSNFNPNSIFHILHHNATIYIDILWFIYAGLSSCTSIMSHYVLHFTTFTTFAVLDCAVCFVCKLVSNYDALARFPSSLQLMKMSIFHALRTVIQSLSSHFWGFFLLFLHNFDMWKNLISSTEKKSFMTLRNFWFPLDRLVGLVWKNEAKKEEIL